MATTNIAEGDSSESRLLALPELLQKIANSLHDESLPTLRLTCKAIEAATFDQFATALFEERLHPLQLAPGRDRDVEQYLSMKDAQHESAKFLNAVVDPRSQIPAWSTERSIQKCLLDLRNLGPNALVELNFSSGCAFENAEERISMRAGLLAAVISTRLTIDLLRLNVPSLVELTQNLDAMGLKLESHMSAVTRVVYVERHQHRDRDNPDRQYIMKLLGSVGKLRGLHLLLSHYRDDSEVQVPSADVVLAVDFSRLDNMLLGQVTVPGKDLAAALSSCKSSLQILHLVDVSVTNNDMSWLPVFEGLRSMTNLSWLQLIVLRVNRMHHLVFKDLAYGKIRKDHAISYKGRQQVAAGLEELLQTTLVAADRDPPSDEWLE